MNIKTGCPNVIDYSKFATPYSGLATMIFVQDASDMATLNGREQAEKDHNIINRWEIIDFYKSRWASDLWKGLGMDDLTLPYCEE